MSIPVYPKALAGWTDKIDQVNTVFAADPNSLAAEILAIESTLGRMPQVEGSPPLGTPVTYGSVSERITDTLLGNQLPYVSLYAPAFNVGYGTAPIAGIFNRYRVLADPHGFFNGSDITIPADGIYLVDVYQAWAPFTTGYVQVGLTINNVWTRGDIWKWDFPDIGAAFLGRPQVDNYPNRNATHGFLWMGSLSKGDRIRVTSENGTPFNPYPTVGATLKAFYLRALPGLGRSPGAGGTQG